MLALLLYPISVYAWSAQVVKIIDGDTVHVKDNKGEMVKIRIYGIDCPELDQAYGKAAKQLTAKLILGKQIEIIPITQDRYQRIIAGIILLDDMVILQDALITSGLAWVDDRFCKAAVCNLWKTHQQDAQNSHTPRGLWKSKKPIPPWTWRKKQKNAINK